MVLSDHRKPHHQSRRATPTDVWDLGGPGWRYVGGCGGETWLCQTGPVAAPIDDAIPYLRRLLEDPAFQTRERIDDRDRVLAEYGRLFHPDNLPTLTAEDFKGFLLYENNRHWQSIHRQGKKLVSDMDRLRNALAILLDESQPISKRLDRMEPANGPKPVPGIGKAVLTPILHVVYPDKYGVWNSISESAMTRLRLWPPFGRGYGFGAQYAAVNTVLVGVADRLATDLWTLDSLWWRIEQEHAPTKHGNTSSSAANASARSQPGRLKGIASMFLCSKCYMSKPVSLQARSEPDLCIDCLD